MPFYSIIVFFQLFIYLFNIKVNLIYFTLSIIYLNMFKFGHILFFSLFII